MAKRKKVLEEKEKRKVEGTSSETPTEKTLPTASKEEQVELVKLSREEMVKHLAKVDEFKNIPKEWRGKDLDIEASEKYGQPMVTTYTTASGEKTTTKPPAERGWKVMLESINIAFNPFADKKGGIVATMGGKTFRSVADFAANHPYTTALAGTGVFFAGKFVVGKAAAGIGTKIAAGKFAALPHAQLGVKTALPYPLVRVGGSASMYATNTVTKKLTGNLLVKAGFSLIASFYIVEKIGSTYPFAQFNISEALQGLGIARYTAFQAGDQDSIDQLNQLQTEILNPVGWESVISKLPWLNIQRSATKIIQAQLKSTEIFNKLLAEARTDEEIEKVYKDYASNITKDM